MKTVDTVNTDRYEEELETLIQLGVDTYFIKNIITKGITVAPERRVESIMDYFEAKNDLPGICVVESNRVIGIVTRDKLMKKLSGRYGFSLHQNKKLRTVMEESFLAVDASTPISAVSEMAMERGQEDLYDFVVVTNKELYMGIVTVRDLLRRATEINVNMARSCNPLTGLPGNIAIADEIDRCLLQERDFIVSYLDLDNFKAFNDKYGFEKGDAVIRLLADVLKEIVAKSGFVGHIGGDDFIAVLFMPIVRFEQRVQSEFEKRAHALYSEKDRQAGYIVTTNRHGEQECFPLVSVTIVSTGSQEKKYGSNYELSEELAARKKEAKKEKAKTHWVSTIELR